MRLGFMAFPVGIGALGDAVSLRWAMICLPVGAAMMLALVPLFRPPQTKPRQELIRTSERSLGTVRRRCSAS
jgi:hypothetical protein